MLERPAIHTLDACTFINTIKLMHRLKINSMRLP